MMTEKSAEQRLRAIEDRLTLLDIEGAYGRAYDGRHGDEWAALFTEDGIYQGRRLPGMPEQNFVQGREALARFCTDQPLSGMHTMHAPHLVLEGDRATGRIHFQFQATGSDEHGWTHSRLATGYYDVAYVRAAEGWRIRRRSTTYVELVQRVAYGYAPTPADLDEPVTPGTFQDARA